VASRGGPFTAGHRFGEIRGQDGAGVAGARERSPVIRVSWSAKTPVYFDLPGLLSRHASLRPSVVSFVGENEELNTRADQGAFRCWVGDAGTPAEAVALAMGWVETNREAMRELCADGGRLTLELGAHVRLLRDLAAALNRPQVREPLAPFHVELAFAMPVPTDAELDAVFRPQAESPDA